MEFRFIYFEKVPSFDGTSYLIYGGFPNIDASPLWNELEFVIRPKSLNGLIFYNGNDMLRIAQKQGLMGKNELSSI